MLCRLFGDSRSFGSSHRIGCAPTTTTTETKYNQAQNCSLLTAVTSLGSARGSVEKFDFVKFRESALSKLLIVSTGICTGEGVRQYWTVPHIGFGFVPLVYRNVLRIEWGCLGCQFARLVISLCAWTLSHSMTAISLFPDGTDLCELDYSLDIMFWKVNSST